MENPRIQPAARALFWAITSIGYAALYSLLALYLASYGRTLIESSIVRFLWKSIIDNIWLVVAIAFIISVLIQLAKKAVKMPPIAVPRGFLRFVTATAVVSVALFFASHLIYRDAKARVQGDAVEVFRDGQWQLPLDADDHQIVGNYFRLELAGVIMTLCIVTTLLVVKGVKWNVQSEQAKQK